MKNIILFDVDGTLYDNNEKIVPKSTIEAIKKLRKDDRNILIIATGRSPYQLDVLRDLDKYFDYKVLINGQVTLKDNELVGSNPIPLELKKGIYDFLDKNKIPGGFIGLTEQSINFSNDVVVKAFEYIETKPPKVSNDFHLNNEIYQIWLFADSGVAKLIEEKFTDVRCVSWYSEGFDILPRGVSKVNGIKRILEKIGTDDKVIYAFGDGNNDVEMIEFADYGIAMGNGADILKKKADYVTDSVSSDGIAKALSHFKLIN